MTESKLPDKINHGDKYGPAMSITDQAEADAYFEICVEHQMRRAGCGREVAEHVERTNLAFWAGHYSNEVRERVERLFKGAHPWFGAIAKVGAPTTDEVKLMARDFVARKERGG